MYAEEGGVFGELDGDVARGDLEDAVAVGVVDDRAGRDDDAAGSVDDGVVGGDDEFGEVFGENGGVRAGWARARASRVSVVMGSLYRPARGA